ncbi:type I pantothenate kinase [Lactobacillus sp. PV034]|uniref:type I pantothenate kinase n=1 Tax=Lactobacillus sp. PV034 TaxID=2594495 RepID=UPI00223F52C4|nr:type I pantothenate kinase [Lactobacillus sp. PV034]QNQ81304.1 type I pantothenate kinase [Lactobacillus sp. PV034]
MNKEYLHLTPDEWESLMPPSSSKSGWAFINYVLNKEIVVQQNSLQELNWRISSPYIIGIAGSVAAGKTTFAQNLKANLEKEDRKVEIISTDSFLMSNAELTAKDLMDQKGFPISINWNALNNFLKNVKLGNTNIPYRLYSQERSDLVPDKVGILPQTDVLIVEGINILELPTNNGEMPSDYVDYAIYLDSSETNLEAWYLERYHRMLDLNRDNPDNFFYKWAHTDRQKADEFAKEVWLNVNIKNLHEYIAPTKKRADMIVTKSFDHSISAIDLKQI